MQYVYALFEIADNEGKICEYSACLENIRQIFSLNRRYILFLSSPIISYNEKSSAITTAFDSYPENIVSFLKLLCKNSKIKNIFDYIKLFKMLENKKIGVLPITVKTAVPLDNIQKYTLISKLEKKYKRKISPTFLTDKDIIGGISLSFSDNLIDYGVYNRLKELKKGFANEKSF